MSVKMSSEPKKGLGLEHEFKMVRGDEGGHEYEHKTEFKKTCDCNQFEQKFTASSKDFSWEGEVTPDAHNKDGNHTQINLEGSCAPAKNEWNAKVGLKFGGREIGPITQWMTTEFETNQSKDHKGTFTSNWNYEKDYHCAWKVICDMKNKMKMTEAYGILLFNNTGHGNWYFRSNCLEKVMAVGCNYNINENLAHSTEVQYDFNKTKTGLFGMPLFYRFGGKWNLKNNCTWNYDIMAGESWTWSEKVEMPVNDNITLSVSDKMNMSAMFSNPKNAGFKWGMGLEIKL
jgi:hypothetical protein